MFTVYRRAKRPDTHPEWSWNPPDVPQYEGVVFTDGKVAVRWLTEYRSISIWESWADLDAIHGMKGHPDYESEVVWGA